MRTLNKERERGTSTVELAIVMPLMLLLLFGIAEFGQAFNQYNTMTKAVRDGVRFAAEQAMFGGLEVIDLNRLDSGGVSVRNRTRNLVVYGRPTSGGTALLPGWNTSDVTVSQLGTDRVQVSANYQYTPLLGEGASMPTFGLGEGPISLAFTFHATVVMRAL